MLLFNNKKAPYRCFNLTIIHSSSTPLIKVPQNHFRCVCRHLSLTRTKQSTPSFLSPLAVAFIVYLVIFQTLPQQEIERCRRSLRHSPSLSVLARPAADRPVPDISPPQQESRFRRVRVCVTACRFFLFSCRSFRVA